MLELIGCLVIGESAVVNGHQVTRIGLCGPAAYTVDGEHLGLELAELFAAKPVEVAPATSGRTTTEGRAHQVETAAPPPAPRPRRRPRAAPAAKVAKPELLTETLDAVPAGARKLFNAAHRKFDGGEAVTLTLASPQIPEPDRALSTVLSAIQRSGLHAELGADRRSIVVAWSAAALAPPTPKNPKDRARAA